MTEKMTISNVMGHVNQFDVRLNQKSYFYSYNSLCVIIDWDNDTIIFGRDWDYSKTTTKHLYAFLGDNLYWLNSTRDKKTIQKAIDTGKINNWSVFYNNDLR